MKNNAEEPETHQEYPQAEEILYQNNPPQGAELKEQGRSEILYQDAQLSNAHEQPDASEFDYDREEQPDSGTLKENRQRSRYVFMTLCFLLGLILLYTYFNGTFASAESPNWFPLIAALVLILMGIVFYRSGDK